MTPGSARAETCGTSARSSLDLSTCVNPYGPPDAVLAALRGMSADAIRRHPYGAAQDVEAAYADYTGQPADEFAAGRGTSDLIWSLARHLDGKTTGLPMPAYTEFRRAFPQARPFGGGASTHPASVLDEAMQACDAVIVSNPHNPTGQVIQRADLAGDRGQASRVPSRGRRVLHRLPGRPGACHPDRVRAGQRHRAPLPQQVLRPGRSPLRGRLVRASPPRLLADRPHQLARLRLRGHRH